MQGFTTILEELVAGHLTRCEMIKRDVKHTLGGVTSTILDPSLFQIDFNFADVLTIINV